ncbi:MAG: hypothetical protein FD123_2478 [Bacteroidetes bacterium]|nr:MAG: hypothetical protein FD123_2478 [Bacteroidota bacterium]
MRRFSFILLSVFLFACGPENEKTKAIPADSAPDTVANKKDTVPDTLVKTPLVLAGVEISVSNGDTVFRIETLQAYDTFLLEEVVCPIEYDGIPDWAGQDSFPPGWEKYSIAKKIEYIESYPGTFNQMCADDSGIDTTPRFPYPSGIRWTFSMTDDRFFELRKMRRPVIDFLLKERRGKRLTDQDLVIIADLNAIEFMPRLIEAERALRPLMLAGARRKLKSKMNSEMAGMQQLNEVINSYQQIRETLTHLLRQEKYAPLLQSAMEKKYEAELRESSKRDYKGPVTSYDQLNEKDRGSTYVDPVYKLPVHQWFSTEILLNRKNLEFIAKCANDYWKNTPDEIKKKSGERMCIAPVER